MNGLALERWWERPWAIAFAMVAATLPLWFVQLPPLTDLLGHMGRYEVQLHLTDSALLRRNWNFHWALIGNLGADLLMEPLGRLLGVETGARLLAALLVPFMMLGQVRLARAVHGTVPGTVWAAFPFAMAYPWHYGLVNYWLGVALALNAAAWAIATPPSPRRTILLVPLTLVLWTTHVIGWAVFAVLLSSHAVTRNSWRKVLPESLKLWPLGTPVLLMAALAYGQHGRKAETLGWFEWSRKFDALRWAVRDQWQWLDLATVGVALLLIAWGLIDRRRFARNAALLLASAIMLIAVIVVPRQLFGSAFADGRMWPIVFMFAILALRPLHVARWVAGVAAPIFALRTAVTIGGFLAYDAAFANHLRGLSSVPAGSRVAVLLRFPCEKDVPWRRSRLDHLDGIAIVRRQVFTNAQWDVPGAQLLVPLGARGSFFNADPSQLVRSRACPADLRPQLAQWIGSVPHDRFDTIWVLGFAPRSLPRWSGLQPVFADDETILYRIDK